MLTSTNGRFFNFEKPQARIKSIALVHKNMKPGGIETLIVRMAQWLSAHDYEVTLFLYSSGGPMLRHLESVKGVTIIVDEDTSDPSINMWMATRMVRKRWDQKFDLVYSFDPHAFLMSYLLPAKKRLSGVYHPESYSSKGLLNVPKTLKLIDRTFYKKLLFMNPAIKNRTEKAIGEPLGNKIFPLPLDFLESTKTLGNHQSRRIVSIGLLAQFRTYNYYMVDVMEKLIQIDPEFTYHIYGTGQGEESLRKKIADSPARAHIFMHGKITNREKKYALQNTFCFVGTGVPLIEAAGSGIPAIVSKINDLSGLTEGYLHELPPFESGDSFSLQKDLFTVENRIEHLLESEIEYRKISQIGRLKANEFESDHVMENFIKQAEFDPYSVSRLH